MLAVFLIYVTLQHKVSIMHSMILLPWYRKCIEQNIPELHALLNSFKLLVSIWNKKDRNLSLHIPRRIDSVPPEKVFEVITSLPKLRWRVSSQVRSTLFGEQKYLFLFENDTLALCIVAFWKKTVKKKTYLIATNVE